MLTPDIVDNFTKISRLVSMGELIDDLSNHKQLVVLDKFGSFVDAESFASTKERIKNAYVEGKFLVDVSPIRTTLSSGNASLTRRKN